MLCINGVLMFLVLYRYSVILRSCVVLWLFGYEIWSFWRFYVV